MAENDDRVEPSGSPAGGDEVRDRIARARESLSSSLRDVAAEAQRDEAALQARAAEELARVAATALGRSLVELASVSDELVSKRLSEALDRLAAEAETRHRSQLAEIRKVVQATIEKSSPSLSRRDRRHELKLARAESSRRVSQALTKLEQRGGSLIGELDARSQAAAERIQDAEQRLREATAALGRADGGHLAAALRRVDDAAGRVGESQERVAAIESQALESASRASASAALAVHAAELEHKLRDAVKSETQAAERMVAAERRLLDLM